MQNNILPPIVEITIISAQNITKNKSYFTFCRRIRPFIILSVASAAKNKNVQRLYETREDEKGGVNPTWGDKFRLSLTHNFFNQRYPGIYLQLYTKHLLLGQSQLGWCMIPASDILNRFSHVGSTQFLSYRLKSGDGSRGQGVVNVAVRLEGSLCDDHSVIGVPVKL
ncbi:hypothetical protein ABFS83_05G102100 [Erythranthe nasuta]